MSPGSRADELKTGRANWGARGKAGVAFASALQFRDVEVELDGQPILRKVSLSLTPGEVVCLLGESGSGKSTMLRVAAGIQHVVGGEVLVNDQVVSSPEVFVPPQKRGVGLMFQDFALFPHMTVLQNAQFGISGLPATDARNQAKAALARVGLEKRENDYPHMLSGGQQQRLALARAIAPRPGILMLDEPFSSLDARLRETVREEAMAILRETRATTLIVTHDPEEAMVLADRIALLRNGRIIQFDSATAIYDHPADLDAARFLSPLTEIEGTVADGRVDTTLGSVPTPHRNEGDRVIVAIRPIGSVEIGLPGEPDAGSVPGRIVAKREALGVDLCEVAVEGIDSPIHLRRRTDGTLNPGTNVVLKLVPERTLVFDAI